MNKVWLIIQREFLNRVQKKSFLIATIVVPLIFPAIIAVLIYVMIQQKENAEVQVVRIYDRSGKIQLESGKQFAFAQVTGDFDQQKKEFQASKDFALLYIPEFDVQSPEGFMLYTRENPSITKVESLENLIETRIRDLKLEQFNIDKETLKNLKTNVSLEAINITESGEEKKSNTGILYGLGFSLGVLIYIFIFVYGSQTMQAIIEEKTSKVVEVLVSSVRPFQLMMGKVIGIASVGLLQFLIWIALITFVTSGVLGMFGLKMPQKQAMEQVSKQLNDPDLNEQVEKVQQENPVGKIMEGFSEIPLGYIAFVFLFYFLGGYLLYGAFFAAVGSAVDSVQESQQFMFPITIPLVVAYMGLFMFILDDPHGMVSFWLSIIPFTSPIAMVGRLAFGVPDWQLLLSMILLVAGFVFTIWVAGRIYRVGILMHGTKVNYKVLVRWFLQKG
jgi:ABC-2 type transport system permease protein